MREALKYSPLCRRTPEPTPSACLAAIYMYHHLYEHVDVLILFFLSNPRNDTYLWDLPTILIILLRLSRKLRQGCYPVFLSRDYLRSPQLLSSGHGSPGDAIGQRARRKGAGVPFSFSFLLLTSFSFPPVIDSHPSDGAAGFLKLLIKFIRRVKMS